MSHFVCSVCQHSHTADIHNPDHSDYDHDFKIINVVGSRYNKNWAGLIPVIVAIVALLAALFL